MRDADTDIESLLGAACAGMLAMDSRSTFPFWDYDMAPLFSELWMERMFSAIRLAGPQHKAQWRGHLPGPSVARKELLYSLFDLKAARTTVDERLEYFAYWRRVLDTMCGGDWLSAGSNKTLSDSEVGALLAMPGWRSSTPHSPASLGALSSTLNALAYSLYSDVFVHQCAEITGPYLLSDGAMMILRNWGALSPSELWDDASMSGHDAVSIATVYEATDFHVDIYNHLTWPGHAATKLLKFALYVDGKGFEGGDEEIARMAREIGARAAAQFGVYDNLSFEDKKRLWVRQRNFQFKRLFEHVGMSWRAVEMEAVVRGKPLHQKPYWSASRDLVALESFWRECLDPRNDHRYEVWDDIFCRYFPD